ncbi:MAG: ABC transporter ATP-binding protein, partial [Clostridia bacterium]|nr:ABC transporter ATP-binding protein [Clostridia bacterium]
MISLRKIGKYYELEDKKVRVLKDISINFREAELVCILGPSGCGKTTLLNIIGGLDRYTSGDLVIDGKSTSDFTDSDWDTYRNHEVGFVFQNYNLINHQTVLENVETALVLSGVGKEERKKRAIHALIGVDLAEHIRKNPKQLSGGEMQRVAIARALVNDPSIILADEPTGALDSKNSLQVMELLKNISANKLVVTVTHNDELAEKYATRIIRISDGEIVSDSNPYVPSAKEARQEKSQDKDKKRKSVMPYSLATKLSFRNLLGKKLRTALTAVASAVAIVGITLVLSCANGLSAFIDKIQRDTMSGTPVQVSTSDEDLTVQVESILGSIITTKKSKSSSKKSGSSGKSSESDEEEEEEIVYTDSVIINHILNKAKSSGGSSSKITNNITRDYLDYLAEMDRSKASYEVEYNVSKYVYKSVDYVFGKNKVTLPLMAGNVGKWAQLPKDEGVVKEQYDLVAGKYPTGANELALVVNKESAVSDSVLVSYYIDLFAAQENADGKYDKDYYTYEEIIKGKDADGNKNNYGKFYLLNADQYYGEKRTEGDVSGYSAQTQSLVDYLYEKNSLGNIGSKELVKSAVKSALKGAEDSLTCYNKTPQEANGYELNIVGIFRLKEDTQYGMFSTSPICYTDALKDKILSDASNTRILKEQLADMTKSVILSSKTDENKTTTYYNAELTTEKSKKSALSTLGWSENPTVIKFYPTTINN